MTLRSIAFWLPSLPLAEILQGSLGSCWIELRDRDLTDLGSVISFALNKVSDLGQANLSEPQCFLNGMGLLWPLWAFVRSK